MTDVTVPWGSQELTFALPDSWEVIQRAEGSLKPADEDWPDRLALALSQPGTGLSLSRLLSARRGGRVVIIIEDVTRHSPLPAILPLVLKELHHAEVEDSQIEIFFATGMHPPMTPQQASDKLGPEAFALKWRSNPWQDRSAYVSVGNVGAMEVKIDRGVAQADLRIILSSVSPHLQAGFGGGYKMLLPGCASIETIRPLHRLGIGKTAEQFIGTDVPRNAMRQAIEAAGELVDQAYGKTFVIQYLLDERDMPASIAAGEPLPTQRMMAKQAAVACGVVVPTQCDVLVTNSYPRDFDLWQSFKGIANTLWAARPGGVVICLSRCEAGLNDMKTVNWRLSQEWTRRLLRFMGPENLAGLIMRMVPRLAGDAAFFIRLALQILHRNPIFMVSPGLTRTGARFPGIRLFETPEQAFAAADELLGGGRQRAIVFPAGGVTYPVPAKE